MKNYEIVYIFDPSLNREDVDKKLAAFNKVLGGEVIEEEHWGVRQFTYPIQKSDAGYYVVIQLSAEPTALPEFERQLRLDEQTMRYLIVLNEGQPPSGDSVVANRPEYLGGEDADGMDGDGDQAGEEVYGGEGGEADGPADADAMGELPPEEAASEDAETASDLTATGEEGEEVSTSDGAEGEEERPVPTTAPPLFSGARGRRRRHEGPPITILNYKDVTTLSRFLTDQGKILPKRTTKVTAHFQRKLGTAVKRARFLALLPYIRDHK